MKVVGFKIIKTDKQYTSYCELLESLTDKNNEEDEDDIELLTLLIEKYDEEHMQNRDLDPIELLELYMEEHKLKSKDLAEILFGCKQKHRIKDFKIIKRDCPKLPFVSYLSILRSLRNP